MRYFDSKFKELVGFLAINNNVPASQILSQIKDLRSFKNILGIAFNQDPSLSDYFSGMDSEDFELFFNRPLIQKILDTNLMVEEEALKKFEQIPLPVMTQQIDKKTRNFFKAEIKGRKVIAYKTSVKVMGKLQIRYRDSKGRFARKI